mmetsp:Transcript_4608/g.13930  ORF Transcript_4608/g.13930 Transcript_4608/m.13930 type:complete len:91 (-) Transcript_4608:1196-1468(-)|eukprot:scaffold148248_cov31-Tisochrysis_lutea.AAC.1
MGWLRLSAGSARSAAPLACEPPVSQLVLLRHGQSEWNSANLFTGWVDVDLSEKGIIEARNAGKLLKEEGIELDVVRSRPPGGRWRGSQLV